MEEVDEEDEYFEEPERATNRIRLFEGGQ